MFLKNEFVSRLRNNQIFYTENLIEIEILAFLENREKIENL